MLPPDIFTDEVLIELAPEVRLTAIGLRLHADDQGRESARTEMVKAAVWPLSEEITLEVLETHLLRLDQAGYITLYAAAGRTYYAITEWPAVSHAARSRHPAPPAPSTRPSFQSTSGSSPEDFTAGERERAESENGEGEGAWRDAEGISGNSKLPPSKFCPEHPVGTYKPCGPCGTARQQASIWDARKRAQAQAEFDDVDPTH